MMEEEKKSFLERLQSADESVKRRWMIWAVAVSMVVVVYLWLGYFNNIVSQGGAAETASASESGQSFLEVMKRGLGAVSSGAMRFFESPKEYTITP